MLCLQPKILEALAGFNNKPHTKVVRSHSIELLFEPSSPTTAIMWKHRIASIARKLFLFQTSFSTKAAIVEITWNVVFSVKDDQNKHARTARRTCSATEVVLNCYCFY